MVSEIKPTVLEVFRNIAKRTLEIVLVFKKEEAETKMITETTETQSRHNMVPWNLNSHP